jgi:hypothetical protein
LIARLPAGLIASLSSLMAGSSGGLETRMLSGLVANFKACLLRVLNAGWLGLMVEVIVGLVIGFIANFIADLLEDFVAYGLDYRLYCRPNKVLVKGP